MILHLGSSGYEVVALQRLLLAAGFDPNGVDGVFGLSTEGAVRRFQNARGLSVDGEVTWPTGETADALKPVAVSLNGPQVVVLDDAVSLATVFEGFSATPYQDSVGVWTIGYGSTRDVLGKPVTAQTPPATKVIAEGLMRRDLMAAVTVIRDDVRVPLTTEETAALVDLVYNIGRSAFAGSTLLRDINAGRFDEASLEFLKWDHAGGSVLAGLLRRRQAERELFLKGQTA